MIRPFTYGPAARTWIVTSALWPVSRFVTVAVGPPSGSVPAARIVAFGQRYIRHSRQSRKRTQCRCACSDMSGPLGGVCGGAFLAGAVQRRTDDTEQTTIA